MTALVALAAFALICLIGWLDYRRVCKREPLTTSPQKGNEP